VIADLMEALEHGDCEIRGAALEGLRSMTAFRDEGWLSLEPPPGSQAAAVMKLVSAEIDDPCDAAAEWAAVILGRIGDRGAYPGLLRIARARPDSPRLVEALTELPLFPTRDALDAIESHFESVPPTRPAARGAAALIYERAALTGDPLPIDLALMRLALLGGDEALAGFRSLLEQPPPKGLEVRWRPLIEATIRKLEQGVEPSRAPPP
jgi:hypothetical protein